MSKYNFEGVETSSNSTSGILLRNIAPYSKVLEFGCATGRMTKYMREELHCEVYIVEIEQSAFDQAICFAKDGVCDDILNLAWVEKFSDVRFDAIIFADVLEHLTKPDIAIREAAGLLAPQGKMLITIPNITHNDILAKAYGDRFDYTSLGLLDDTHVHFWGLENIMSMPEMAKPNELFLQRIEAVSVPIGMTEQSTTKFHNVPQMIQDLLQDRLCGEVYQFAVTLGKEPVEPGTEIIQIKRRKMDCVLYLDDGEGFREEASILLKAERSGPCRYSVHYELKDVSGIKSIRFDPVEQRRCILQNISVRQAGHNLEPQFVEPYQQLNAGVYLYGSDPMVIFTPEQDAGSVIIDADILMMGDTFVNLLEENLRVTAKELSQEKERIIFKEAVLKDEVERLQEFNRALVNEKEGMQSILSEKERALEKLMEMNVSLAQKCNLLAAEIDEYTSCKTFLDKAIRKNAEE